LLLIDDPCCLKSFDAEREAECGQKGEVGSIRMTPKQREDVDKFLPDLAFADLDHEFEVVLEVVLKIVGIDEGRCPLNS
jgi:hypothetical protein